MDNQADTEPVLKLEGISRYGSIQPRHSLPAGETHHSRFAIPRESVPKDEETAWNAKLRESVTITFRMYGHRWERTGDGPVKRLD